MYKAIDVSDNQGKINWPEVAAAGIKHAILRSVLKSGKPDRQFINNLAGCRANGIRVDVYKYTYATSPEQAAAEATKVVDLLKASSLDCRVWWDVEDKDILVPLGKQRLTACIAAARRAVEAAGLLFGIYTGLDFFQQGYFDTNAFSCPYWIARYPLKQSMTIQADPPADKRPNVAGAQLWGWQYTSKGLVPGINTLVDVSQIYDDIDLTEQDEGRETYYLQDVYGVSISAALRSIGVDGSFSNREEIAKVNGIKDYVGSAEQNMTMLSLLQRGRLAKPY